MINQQQFMEMALEEAQLAFEEGEVPVGAVLVRNGAVISQAHNRTIACSDPTAHAEMLVIQQASELLGRQRLTDCSLYVTLEPCPMCAGAIVNARIQQLFFGAFDMKAGATGTLYSITTDRRLNHYVETCGGVLDSECAELLQRFFRERREQAGHSASEHDSQPPIRTFQ
jgi:tRNA(adenine34) deaminase